MARRITYLVMLLWTIFPAASFAQDLVIKGKIMDRDIVLVGATVDLAGKIITSNATGEFSISAKPGTHTIVITHAGYKRFESRINTRVGENLFFQFVMQRNDELGEVVVLGSRSQIQRSNLNTAVPVDVITATALKETGQQSMIQMINFTVPSFNASRQNLIEPVTLRGLGPDHLLILVNGIRFHSNYYLNDGTIRGSLGRGSVNNDLNAIPFSAIEKIEILRDGASAQYGSDAIGGVLNLELKKSISNLSARIKLGQHYKGDGEALVVGLNQGIKFLKKGTLNFSGDLSFRQPTHRGGYYLGTVYYPIPAGATATQRDSITNLDNEKINQRGFDRKRPVSNDGFILLNTAGFLMNSVYPLSNKIELRFTGMANYRHADWPVQFRFPKNTNQVNTLLYPDGFKANAIMDTWNISGILAASGKTNNGWKWEWSSIYGENRNKQSAKNSNNASQQFLLGANAPTEFSGGKRIFSQQTNILSFVKDLAKKNHGPASLNLSFGAEYRFENIQSYPGDEASWKNYDSTGKKLGGATGAGSGGESNAVNARRSIFGFYTELETDINDRLLISTSGRLEQYGDYGQNLAGKLAFRYEFSRLFTFRSSISNGYHAPALQQTDFKSLGSTWKEVGGVRIPGRIGIFGNNSDVAKAFGIRKMKPEKALNLSAGFTSLFSSHISMTVDAYWIQIKDRIILSGRFDRTNPDVNTILLNYPDVDQVQFVTNAINTRNQGLDLVLNGKWKIRKANLNVVCAANFNRTNLFGAIQTTEKLSPSVINTNTLFNREEQTKIEKGQPGSKIIVSGNYVIGKFGFLVRNTHFGKTAYAFVSDDPSRDEFYAAKILSDIGISYSVGKRLQLTGGVNNVFDIYPDPVENPLNRNEGITVYSHESAPFGFTGGYYFLMMGFNLDGKR